MTKGNGTSYAWNTRPPAWLSAPGWPRQGDSTRWDLASTSIGYVDLQATPGDDPACCLRTAWQREVPTGPAYETSLLVGLRPSGLFGGWPGCLQNSGRQSHSIPPCQRCELKGRGTQYATCFTQPYAVVSEATMHICTLPGCASPADPTNLRVIITT